VREIPRPNPLRVRGTTTPPSRDNANYIY